MLRYRAVFALLVWTFLVWTTRIGNIWTDDDLDTAAKWGRTGLAISFTVMAAAVIVALWYRERGGIRRAVLILCGWTVAVWSVRSVAIVFGDWSAGFKTVHVMLAIVSCGLAVWSIRSLSPVRRPTLVSAGRGETAERREPVSDSGSHRRL